MIPLHRLPRASIQLGLENLLELGVCLHWVRLGLELFKFERIIDPLLLLLWCLNIECYSAYAYALLLFM